MTAVYVATHSDDEILISDALVHELECQPPTANHAVVERLCVTLPAKRAAVVWKLRNHAQFHPGYADAMHRIARALRKQV